MKDPNDMKSLKVICIKTFTINTIYGNITYTENTKYHLIQYIKDNIFYIYEEKIENQSYPTLNMKYRKNFATEKEIRKNKLNKLKNLWN